MRLFIAAPLPPFVQSAIFNEINAYQQPGVRAVPEANWHLTIHFLGETAEHTLPVLSQNLAEIGRSHKPFTLQFKEIAPGPKINSPRLVWVRFNENPAFAALAKAVSAAFPTLGKSHPDFIPHITIGRIKKENLTKAALPVISNISFPDFEVSEIALWRSELNSPHPIYTILQKFELMPGR